MKTSPFSAESNDARLDTRLQEIASAIAGTLDFSAQTGTHVSTTLTIRQAVMIGRKLISAERNIVDAMRSYSAVDSARY